MDYSTNLLRRNFWKLPQLPWVTLQADHRSIGSSMVLEVWSATCQSMLLHVYTCYTCYKSYTCDCDVTCGLRGSCWSPCRPRWSWGWAACGYCCGSRPTKMTNVNISIIIETSYMFNIYMYICILYIIIVNLLLDKGQLMLTRQRQLLRHHSLVELVLLEIGLFEEIHQRNIKWNTLNISTFLLHQIDLNIIGKIYFHTSKLQNWCILARVNWGLFLKRNKFGERDLEKRLEALQQQLL